MANRFLRPGTHDRKTYVDQISRDFDVMWKRSNEEIDVLDRFFETIDETAGSDFKIGSIGSSLPMMVESEDGPDNLQYGQVAPGFTKTITYVPYRLGAKLTQNLMLMERYGKISSLFTGLPKSAKAKKAALRAAIMNGAFSGTDGADSLSLCNDSHPHENNEYGTWDNNGTGPASVSNCHALRQLALSMTNEWGRPMPVTLQEWLCPIALDTTFEQLKMSRLDPETALNTENVFLAGKQYTVCPNLTSDTAYFGFGDLMGEDKGIFEVFLMRPTVMDNSPADATIIMDKQIKMVVGHGFSTSKNIYGSSGS